MAKQSIDQIEMDYADMSKYFDSSEPTEFWNGDSDGDFADDSVIIVLKGTID